MQAKTLVLSPSDVFNRLPESILKETGEKKHM